jgi:trimethylamine-N-oxide reductase (cytochrome c)
MTIGKKWITLDNGSARINPGTQVIKGTSLINGENGPPAIVDICDGRITRIRPFHYCQAGDTKESLNSWRITARGKTFGPPDKSVLSFVGLSYKKRVYSENRVRYPLKRADWDPKGARNPQNRGKSRYVRISWDEAAQLVADELLRVKEKYGMSAVLAETDLHGEGKHVHGSHGCANKLLGYLGGYTVQMRNEDSWEGWYWGSKHVWGCEPVGEMMPMANLYPDIAEYADLLLFWGCDPEVTPLGINGHMASRLCYWLSELGLKSVYICPDLNYGAAVHADKWIPVLPNTDAALQLAIAYIWLTEGSYEKDYIDTHAVGFDRFKAYILGEDDDATPKTPAWASEKCGVPEWTIKALARDWAAKITSIIHGNGGPMVRGPYSTEPARLESMLLGMRALGSPGVHQAKMIEWTLWNDYHPLPYRGAVLPHIPTFSEALRPAANSAPMQAIRMLGKEAAEVEERAGLKGGLDEVLKRAPFPPSQFIPKCMIHDAIVKDRIEWWGMGQFNAPTPDQFIEYSFPADGCSRIHMVWTDSPCMTTCWNDGNAYIDAMRSPEIEFMVAQHPWLENDCLLADLILPVATKYELYDLGEDVGGGVYTSVYLEEQACPPVGESLSDLETVLKIAEKLDPAIAKAMTGGYTPEEMVELFYSRSGIDDILKWDEFKNKKIYVIPCIPEKIAEVPAGLRLFYEDPKNNPLTTPTGLLEFTSTALDKCFPDDPERPPIPKWIEKGESHDERRTSARAKKYPLLCMSNHGRWRMHAQCDDITWTREIETMKIRGGDGYQYEPVWLHPAEAEKRGIRHGDIVKVYNERGVVLAGAYVTERLTPGVAYVDHGARLDPIDVGKIDRGGAINTITPHNNTSKNSTGMAVSGFLVEVAKVTDEEMDGWKNQFPEAFARKIDPATGVCLDGWLIENKK